MGIFLWYSALGAIPKTIALMLFGYFFGAAFNQIDSYLGKTALLLFVVSAAAAVYLLSPRADKK
jgi:membrane protein DedA with SNARE-associated domain